MSLAALCSEWQPRSWLEIKKMTGSTKFIESEATAVDMEYREASSELQCVSGSLMLQRRTFLPEMFPKLKRDTAVTDAQTEQMFWHMTPYTTL